MGVTVVTGGAGFLGSHLCERLLGRGERVVCVDNLFTGRLENVAHLLDDQNFTFLEHDIIDPLYLDDLEVNRVYNLACPASPVHYQFNAIRTVKANVLGVTNMLGLAKRHGARILQASTSEVYGDPSEHPQRESYRGSVNCTGPRACYDEGKRCAETLMFDYHRQHGVDIRVIRIFNTYGPRMSHDDGRVVSNFIVQALRGDPITIYGEGAQTRSFCFVDDLVSGMMAMMDADGLTGPINLGNPREFTILELAQKVIALTGSSSGIVREPLPQDDPRKRKPDISFARSSLGWSPAVTLDEGLRRTVSFFADVLGEEGKKKKE